MKSSVVKCLLAFASFNLCYAVSASQAASDHQRQQNISWTGEPLQKTGQILGVSEKITDPSTLVFELATGFQVGHVGIAVALEDLARAIALHPQLDPDGYFKYLSERDQDRVVVFHSDPAQGPQNGRGGVGASPIRDFIRMAKRYSKDPNTIGEEFDFMHIQPRQELSIEQKDALIFNMLILAQRTNMHKLEYNFSQSMQSVGADHLPVHLNCSEFVHYVFHKIGLQVGRPQQMKHLNLAIGFGLLKQYFKFTGLYSADAWCVTPKSVMQAAVYDVTYNQNPPFEVNPKSGRDPAITNSDKDIIAEWWEKSEKSSLLKTFKVICRSSTAFEKNCFRQSYQDATGQCEQATHFYGK